MKETKYCPGCEKDLPRIAFHLLRKNKPYLQTNCIDCKRRMDAEYNQTSDKKRKRKQERAAAINEWLDSYKSEQGCAYCVEHDALLLDFHHFGNDKKYTIANMRLLARTTIENEIKKCVVVCCKCHRKIHAGRKGPWDSSCENNGNRGEFIMPRLPQIN